VDDALDDAEQVEGAAREAVDPLTVTTSPGGEGVEHLSKLDFCTAGVGCGWKAVLAVLHHC